jgi:SAM-dependent MidA family methyltransferase
MPAAVFTEKQVAIIRDFLDDFRDASKKDKPDLIKNASCAVIESTRNLDKRQRKEIRKVSEQKMNISVY